MVPPHSGYSSTEIWIELEFGNVGFWGEGKSEVPGEKPLGAEKRTNNKLNPHIVSSSRIDPKSHWRETSALTTAPSLLPQFKANTMTNTINLQAHNNRWPLLVTGSFSTDKNQQLRIWWVNWLLHVEHPLLEKFTYVGLHKIATWN